MTEKIQILKNNQMYVYTGDITFLDNDEVLIKTIFGEEIIVFRNQIQQRQRMTPEEVEKVMRRRK